MPTFRRPTRREVLATGAAAIVTSLLPRQRATAAQASSGGVPTGPGSVLGAPNLPAGFANTFASRYVDANGVRLHAVVGGKGRPLLLVHGWPQTWYQWRLVMPALAHDFEVIAVDQRGIGLSDKPESGYDEGAQANDMVALMEALGHRRFAMVGFDTGMPIAYALAADHPESARTSDRRRGRHHRRHSFTAAAGARPTEQAALAYRLQSPRRLGE